MQYAELRIRSLQGDLSRDWLLQLLDMRCECEWVDYKELLPLDDQQALAGFAKDVLALHNSGGGYLVLGVRNLDWSQVGFASTLPYDSKLLVDKVRKVSGLDLEITIASHGLRIGEEWRFFGLIHVRGPSNLAKLRGPSRPAKDFCSKEKWGIVRGIAYYRVGESTTAVGEAEIPNVAARLEEKLGTPIPTQEVSPFAVDSGFYKLLAKGYESFIGRAALRTTLLAAIERDPRIWIVNVHGPGGVGKSALVNWYTHESYHEKRFEGILQVTAKVSQLTPHGIRRVTPTLHSLEDLLDTILLMFGESAERLDRKRALAYEVLSSFRFLVVLDNMETVEDARVLEFVQGIPAGSDTKVLLTSRRKTGGWECPVYVPELSQDELREFISVKARELGVEIGTDSRLLERIHQNTGGLPLAALWLLGRFKLEQDVESAFGQLRSPDSPVLEFSFRNIWKGLSKDSRELLGALSVFDAPPAIELLSIATEWPIERVDAALGDLETVTLVNKVVQKPSGRVVYTALPLTLDFASREVARGGTFLEDASRRYQEFLSSVEHPYSDDLGYRFEKYGITSDVEKRAARLARRAESSAFAGNRDLAESLFSQSRDLAPASAYVLCQVALFELQRGDLRAAEAAVGSACSAAANKKLKAYCFSIKASVLEKKGDRPGQLGALRTSVDHDASDIIGRHRYGVALSRAGEHLPAIEQFTWIIESELPKRYPPETLMMALVTRARSYARVGEESAARADLDLARELMAKHVHFQGSAPHVARLEIELGAHG